MATIHIHYDDIDETYQLTRQNKRGRIIFYEKIIELILEGYEPDYYINLGTYEFIHISKMTNNEDNYILRDFILELLHNHFNPKRKFNQSAYFEFLDHALDELGGIMHGPLFLKKVPSQPGKLIDKDEPLDITITFTRKFPDYRNNFSAFYKDVETLQSEKKLSVAIGLEQSNSPIAKSNYNVIKSILLDENIIPNLGLNAIIQVKISAIEKLMTEKNPNLDKIIKKINSFEDYLNKVKKKNYNFIEKINFFKNQVKQLKKNKKKPKSIKSKSSVFNRLYNNAKKRQKRQKNKEKSKSPISNTGPSHKKWRGFKKEYIKLQSGGKRLVRYGPKGGKYYMKGGKKYYLK